MKTSNILHILPAKEKQIEGLKVMQPFPTIGFRYEANPFILLHHGVPVIFNPGDTSERVPPHPHRGFAPVTFLYDGEHFHRDSLGNNDVIKAGGAQWMNSNKGLLHSEGPTEDFLKKGGKYQLLQLWVNIPKKHKWDDPIYQNIHAADMPKIEPQDGVVLHLVSGEYNGKIGPAKIYSPIISMMGSAKKGKEWIFNVNPDYWSLLYIVEGIVRINDTDYINQHSLVVFDKGGDTIKVEAQADVRFLFLSAKPLDEPVVPKEVYVMNTIEEIEQAKADYRNGKFGELDF